MTSAPTTTRAPRLPSLTGLRWVAALLVFGFHAGTMRIVAEPDLKAVVDKAFSLGLSGVEFFFILSGFVLVWSYRDGEPGRTFLWRRVAKIYPNHVVTFLAALAVAAWFADPVPRLAALGNLLLVQAWIPFGGYFYSVNNVSWSLSCELAFYLCLPLAVPWLRRARTRALRVVLVAAPLLILALWPGQQLVPEEQRWWFTQIFPVTRSFEFWMGAAAAELMRRNRWRGPDLTVASLLFVGTWVVAAFWVRAEFWAALLAVAYLLVITAAAQADVRGRWTPWRSRTMVWLGEVSFAFYLVHVLVMVTVLRLTGDWGTGLPGWRGPLAVLGFLLLNLALAAALHRWVEVPMMRRLGPRRPRPTPAAAAPARSVPAPRSPADAGAPTPIEYAGRRGPD
ncbi:Peptidoglycan/LPS O-acetylase OafA/YrhL, contains acyltransferase and SGNH-hydrolase domains [Micromonospora sediminicola]|uniref:Peptidoglycan/LPS O-acetylase OafA/YrhL, contains acyltransferase and SGNH-hydrolase domains n=1 Tax=Micromonospora sediminicola TaxID=946078 RepID=A0A1A9BDR1_9ACTN|nr:acyltransferase [Micromonospora sediminicola]SBT67650.1 Peptidoglycan/LPS O-acetylase OafA/YrhL, contains acyltransferase and SGNH-hydrolase domains [Micromonospora sediminicola]